jgi:hypothetical protein
MTEPLSVEAIFPRPASGVLLVWRGRAAVIMKLHARRQVPGVTADASGSQPSRAFPRHGRPKRALHRGREGNILHSRQHRTGKAAGPGDIIGRARETIAITPKRIITRSSIEAARPFDIRLARTNIALGSRHRRGD